MSKSNKEKIVALILCIFLGTLGVHRFYVGKTKSGILYLCTLGLFGIGWIYDIFNIANNLFTDSYGAVLTSENANQNILNESKKKPAHMMWQFWVAVVVLYVFVFAMPSNSNTEPTQQTSTDVFDTDTSIVSVPETSTDTSSTEKTDSTDISDSDSDKTNSYTDIEKNTNIDTNSTSKNNSVYTDIDLCTTDTDVEIYNVVFDKRKNEYHLNEKCKQLLFTSENDKDYYIIKANSINSIDKYFKDKGAKHCTNCVKLDSDSDTTSEQTSSTHNESTQSITSVTPQLKTYTFTVNTATNKFHSKACGPSKEIAQENRLEIQIQAYSKQEAINKMQSDYPNYDYCQICANSH